MLYHWRRYQGFLDYRLRCMWRDLLLQRFRHYQVGSIDTESSVIVDIALGMSSDLYSKLLCGVGVGRVALNPLDLLLSKTILSLGRKDNKESWRNAKIKKIDNILVFVVFYRLVNPCWTLHAEAFETVYRNWLRSLNHTVDILCSHFFKFLMKRNLIFLDILSQTAWTEISFNFGSFFFMTLGVLLIIVQAGSKIRPFNLIFICCLNSVGNSSEEYRRLGFAGFAVRWSVIYVNKAFLHWTFQAQRIPWILIFAWNVPPTNVAIY